MNDNDIIKALGKAVSYYNDKVKAFLSQGNYPSGQDAYRKEYKPIQDTANIGNARVDAGSISQTITYGSPKEAPYATAYEFGSGEHIGQGTYPIKGKNGPLAIGKAGLLRGRSGWKPVNRAGVLSSKKFRCLV